jgi:restriction system protein
MVELIGGYGTGKTTLLRSLAQEKPSIVNGAIEYFIGSPMFPLQKAIETIADRFRTSRGHSLLVVDEADRLDKGDILESVNRLGTGPWRFSTVLSSTVPLGLGQPVSLGPMSCEDMGRMLEGELDRTLPREDLVRLWAALQGSPRLAQILSEQWRAGRVRTLDALADLLNPLAVPGLVDPHGRPLARNSHEERTIISDVCFVSEELLQTVGRDPELVHALTPKEFELLSAELFERQGYKVTLTPQTRDGGKDLYLAKADGFGSFLYIVECKRYAPDRAVDVGVVRALYGVAQHERVSAAMTLTTSYFSSDAEAFAAELKYQMFLKDFIDLKFLLAPFR